MVLVNDCRSEVRSVNISDLMAETICGETPTKRGHRLIDFQDAECKDFRRIYKN